MVGAAIAGAAIQGGMGLGTSALNNWWAQKREQDARAENFKYNEYAADFADKRTRKLYEDFESPEALLRQYKAANLSPSLMFGGAGGTSGMTQGAQGAGVNGISPTVYGAETFNAAQIAKTIAETQNIQQDTKKKAQETDLTAQQIQKTIAETDNTTLKNTWQEYENVNKLLDTQIKEQTEQDYIDLKHLEVEQYINLVKKLKEEVRSAKVQADIDEKTEEGTIQFLNNRVNEQMARIILNKCQSYKAWADINMTSAQMAKLVWDIKKENKQLAQTDYDLVTKRKELMAQIEQWAIENGFKEKDQQIAIAKIVLNAFITLRGQDLQTFGKVLDAISPFSSGGSVSMPNIGMPPIPD